MAAVTLASSAWRETDTSPSAAFCACNSAAAPASAPAVDPAAISVSTLALTSAIWVLMSSITAISIVSTLKSQRRIRVRFMGCSAFEDVRHDAHAERQKGASRSPPPLSSGDRALSERAVDFHHRLTSGGRTRRRDILRVQDLLTSSAGRRKLTRAGEVDRRRASGESAVGRNDRI